MKATRGLLLVSALLSAFAVVAAAQADPHVGTWTLNIAKSKYDPGPPPKSGTRKYEANGDGLQSTQDLVPATGSPTTSHWAAQFDGKYVPITGQSPYDSIAIKRSGTRTFVASLKKGRKMVLTSRTVVSRDGKVLTANATGTDAAGKAMHNVTVWDKQ